MPGIRLGAPASDQKIAAAEAQLQSTFPAELREYLSTCNGLVMKNGPEFPPLESSISYFGDALGSVFSQLLVVADNGQSDPICVFHKGPLRGYVAHVCHEADSHVRWRRFGSLLQKISDQLRSEGEVDVEGLPGDLDAPLRTDYDIEAARATIQFASTLELHSADSPFIYGLGFDLLGEPQAPEIAAFLEHEDMFVARAARDRLRQLRGELARLALQRHQQELEDLVGYCADLFRRQVRSVTVENGCNLFVGPERLGLNVDVLYAERKRPDFDQWVLGIGRRA